MLSCTWAAGHLTSAINPPQRVIAEKAHLDKMIGARAYSDAYLGYIFAVCWWAILRNRVRGPGDRAACCIELPEDRRRCSLRHVGLTRVDHAVRHGRFIISGAERLFDKGLQGKQEKDPGSLTVE